MLQMDKLPFLSSSPLVEKVSVNMTVFTWAKVTALVRYTKLLTGGAGEGWAHGLRVYLVAVHRTVSTHTLDTFLRNTVQTTDQIPVVVQDSL